MIKRIQNIFKTKTLKKRFYAYFALMGFPCLLALVSYQYIVARNAALKMTKDSFANIAENAVISFNSWKDLNEKRLEILTAEVKEHLAPSAKNRAELLEELKLFTTVYKDTYIAHVLNTSGLQISRSDSDKPFTSYGDREYFKEALAKKRGEQTVISKTYSKPAICNALSIEKNKKTVAVVATCVFLKDLRDRIAHDHIGKTGSYVLINEKNQVIAENTDKLVDASEDPAIKALRSGHVGEFSYTENNIEWYSYVQPLSRGWAIILKQQQSEIIAATNRHLQKTLLLTLVLFAIATAVIFQTFNYFLKPIFDLTDSFEAQKNSPEKIKLPRPEEQELALLADAFNSATSSLQESIQSANNQKVLLEYYQKMLEIKINDQSKLLNSKEKTANLGVVAGNIAHEIRNPLSVISTCNQMIKTLVESKNLYDATKVLSASEKIDTTIERILKIVRGIQSITRNAENDPMEETSLPKLMEDILEIYKPHLTSKNIQLQIENIPNTSIHCRGVQISQVIVNLLNNAADAVETLNEKWVKINFYENEHILRITVTDSGKGIPAEIANHLMEDYFTTKGAHKGTGLGLSISKQLIHAHGGNFYLNRAHPNTQFIIELPVKNT